LSLLALVAGCPPQPPEAPAPAPTEVEPSPSEPEARPAGVDPDWVVEATGDAIGPAGDVNGDGYADFWTRDTPLNAAPDPAFRVYTGSEIGPSAEPIFVLRTGDRRTWIPAATPIGDIDGDGFDDLAVNFQPEDYQSRVHLLYGGPDGPRLSEVSLSGGDFCGAALAGGDLDGDGFDDLVLSVDTRDDEVRWHRGAPAGIRPEPDGRIELPGWHFQNGAALATGDLDADGFDDLAIGLRTAEVRADRGRVVVHRGGEAGPSATRTWGLVAEGFDGFGHDVAIADANGDGVEDLLVAAPLMAPDLGGIYLVPGSRDGLRVDEVRAHHRGCVARTCWAEFAAGGDLDGDGRGDLAVQLSPWAEHGALSSVLLVIGGPDGLAGSGQPLTAPLLPSRFAFLGDLDGDGIDELGLVPGVWDLRALVWRGYAPGQDRTRRPDAPPPP